jgi:dsDNA-specific endonuclease/ATPase MutS2
MIEEDVNDETNFEEIVNLPIDGVLDLHTFAPQEVKDLVPTYLNECLELGITEVQIIHGKGKGVLRKIVHSILDRYPNVISYNDGNSWGSTVVTLRKTVSKE